MGLDLPLLTTPPPTIERVDGIDAVWLGDQAKFIHGRTYLIEPLAQREPDLSQFRPFVRRLNLELMIRPETLKELFDAATEKLRKAGVVFALLASLAALHFACAKWHGHMWLC
jgi:hypothetical protein